MRPEGELDVLVVTLVVWLGLNALLLVVLTVVALFRDHREQAGRPRAEPERYAQVHDSPRVRG
jgi:hypothetical protein